MAWEEIDAPGGDVRLSRCAVNDEGIVTTSADVLLAQARRVVGDLTMEQYALARVINSEAGSGPPAELLAIGDADLNRATIDKLSVFDHVTARSHVFGKQGSKTPAGRSRPVATTRDPYLRHYRAARLLLSGAARGISAGATQYLSPRTQLAMWLGGSSSYMHPRDVVRKWTFGLSVTSRERDGDGRTKVTLSAGNPALTSSDKEPVFVCGVDPWEQLFFRRATSVDGQARRHAAAQAMIDSGGKQKPPCDGDDAALAAWLALAGAVAVAMLERS